MAKYLVINGDDFGANHAHNSGVVKAFTEGIMTTAGIITASPWFAEAVMLAKKYSIPVGVHLAFSCEYKYYQFGPLTRAPELSLDGKGYVFKRSPNDVGLGDIKVLMAELSAQVQRLLDTGIEVTHIEKHMDSLPRWDGAMAGVVDALCDKFGIPFQDIRSGPPRRFYQSDLILPVSEYFTFRGDTFEEKKADILKRLEGLKDGLYWFFVHPTDNSKEMDAASGGAAMRKRRYAETLLLCDADVKAKVKECGIQLIDAKEAARVTGLVSSPNATGEPIARIIVEPTKEIVEVDTGRDVGGIQDPVPAPNYLKESLNAAVYTSLPEVCIRNWMTLGPFSFNPENYAGDEQQDVTEDDSFIEGDECALVARDEGTEECGAVWKKYSAPADDRFPYMIDLARFFGDMDHALVYLVAHIHSSEDVENYSMYFGTDDYVKVWVNGELIYTYKERTHGVFLDDGGVGGIALHKGWNKLVVKCVNIRAGWGVLMRFADEKDRPIITATSS